MTQNGSIREKKWSKSKFENFALPMGPWVPDLVIFCRFSKMKILSIFSILAGWICLILHILVVLIVLDHLTTRNYLSWGHTCAKLGQFYRKKGKILISGYFFESKKRSEYLRSVIKEVFPNSKHDENIIHAWLSRRIAQRCSKPSMMP